MRFRPTQLKCSFPFHCNKSVSFLLFPLLNVAFGLSEKEERRSVEMKGYSITCADPCWNDTASTLGKKKPLTRTEPAAVMSVSAAPLLLTKHSPQCNLSEWQWIQKNRFVARLLGPRNCNSICRGLFPYFSVGTAHYFQNPILSYFSITQAPIVYRPTSKKFPQKENIFTTVCCSVRRQTRSLFSVEAAQLYVLHKTTVGIRKVCPGVRGGGGSRVYDDDDNDNDKNKKKDDGRVRLTPVDSSAFSRTAENVICFCSRLFIGRSTKRTENP